MDQQIGRYQILEEIASGGQGTVYRAYDPEGGQIIALKVLHRLSPETARTPSGSAGRPRSPHP